MKTITKNKLETRLEAIKLVMTYRSVLTDEEFVYAMKNATIIDEITVLAHPVETDEPIKVNIFEGRILDYIFQDRASAVKHLYLVRKLMLDVAMDETVSPELKNLFIDYHLNKDSVWVDWLDFKAKYNA